MEPRLRVKKVLHALKCYLQSGDGRGTDKKRRYHIYRFWPRPGMPREEEESLGQALGGTSKSC